jgi:hypothetical protein
VKDPKKKKKSKNRQIHICGFHCAAKHIEGWLKICTLFQVCSQIWLNLPKDDHQFFYIFQWVAATLARNTNLWQKTLVGYGPVIFFSFFKCCSTGYYPHTDSVIIRLTDDTFSRSIKSVASMHTCGHSPLKKGRNLANWFFKKRGFSPEKFGSVNFWGLFVQKKRLIWTKVTRPNQSTVPW